ncbi:apiosidase-like domain-containing protein [Candidatus Nitrospira bockiana]
MEVEPPSSRNQGRLVRNGRALRWENTGEQFLVMGQTAYAIAHRNIPWQSVLSWIEANGFTLVRMDLVCTGFKDPDGMTDTWLWGGTPGNPDFSRFNLAQWDKLDAIFLDGLARGLVFEVGAKIAQHLPTPGPNRTRYLRYLAARVGAYPHIIFLEDFEISGPMRGGIVPHHEDLQSLGADFSAAFQGYPYKPLLGVHPHRNATYYDDRSAGSRLVNHLLHLLGMASDRLFFGELHYHRVSRETSGDFRGQKWLTIGIFHERWKMEGYGILQHRPHFDVPMYVGEAVYENTDHTVGHSVTAELDEAGLRHEVISNPRFYYRRYVVSVILSGGLGMTYGLQGLSAYRDDQNTVLKRYATGHPASQDGKHGAEGYKDMRKVLAYFRAKRLDLNTLDPDDTRINNGFSSASSNVLSRRIGLKRAKFARVHGCEEYYAYNPYHTDLTITGIPAGLSIEVFNPQTGAVYPGGQTNGSTRFSRPSEFAGDYVLHLS